MIYTDGFPEYSVSNKEFAGHETVNHGAGEYPRGDVQVDTCERFSGLLMRGIIGAFHHVSKTHLPRDCDEFAFCSNYRKVTDKDRTCKALAETEGERLMLRLIRRQRW